MLLRSCHGTQLAYENTWGSMSKHSVHTIGTFTGSGGTDLFLLSKHSFDMYELCDVMHIDLHLQPDGFREATGFL